MLCYVWPFTICIWNLFYLDRSSYEAKVSFNRYLSVDSSLKCSQSDVWVYPTGNHEGLATVFYYLILECLFHYAPSWEIVYSPLMFVPLDFTPPRFCCCLPLKTFSLCLTWVCFQWLFCLSGRRRSAICSVPPPTCTEIFPHTVMWSHQFPASVIRCSSWSPWSTGYIYCTSQGLG